MITHPRLAHAIMYLRPGTKSGVDFVVQQRAGGVPTLVEGSMANPPTQREVDAVTDEQLDYVQSTKNGIPDISDRQFAQQLKAAGLITHAEALAFVATGTVPAALQALVDAIDDQAEREAAEILIAGATVFKRNHPLVTALGQAYGMTERELSAFWYAASKL